MDAQIAALRERANVREPIRSRHGGNDEAARVYRAFGRECHMAFTAMAQEPGRIYRLGLLTSYPPYDPAQADTVVALLGALRQGGFIEGKNLTLVVRAFGLHRELMSEYAAELVKAQVDVIYTGGPSGIRAVQQATQTIPILAITDDMLGSGLVKSMSRTHTHAPTRIYSYPSGASARRDVSSDVKRRLVRGRGIIAFRSSLVRSCCGLLPVLRASAATGLTLPEQPIAYLVVCNALHSPDTAPCNALHVSIAPCNALPGVGCNALHFASTIASTIVRSA
jgi:hypothetical protein